MRSFWKYLITLIVGFACVAGIAVSKDLLSQVQPDKVYHILCDSFFVVGVVMFNLGLLIFVSNEGAFDMMVYGVRSFVDLFRKKSTLKHKTFFDYTESRADKKLRFSFLLICGAFFLAVSLVMYYLYTQHI